MLIVFEPDHVAHLEQVIAAVKQYFPGVAIRRLVEDEAHHPQIATFPETDRAGAEPKPEAPGSSDPEGVSQRKELLDDADIPSAPLVTEQELAMLIEPVFDEPAGDEPNER